jgi:quinol monooxygenase YgiN
MVKRWHMRGGLLALGVLLAALAPTARGQDDPIIAFVKPKLKNPDKPFTLMVGVKVKEGEGKKFEEAFAKALTATRKEKGCITYDLNHDTANPARYLVYERWKSLADLEAHLKSDHIKALLAVLPDVTSGPPDLHVLLPASE